MSSSRIRQLIRSGKLTAARRLLGRPPALYGVVVRGAGRGRRLGFPTANIRLHSQVLPPQGVYAVIIERLSRRKHWQGVTPPPLRTRSLGMLPSERLPTEGWQTPTGGGLSRRGGGVMNLGVRPTFGTGPLVCEVHVLGFAGRLLGQRVAVSLLARLRGERCFPTPQALVRQVQKDVQRAAHLFKR